MDIPVDICSEDNPNIVQFHKERTMFIIHQDQIYIRVEQTSDSHYEWSLKQGWVNGPDDPAFVKMVRGYYRNGELHAYTDSNNFSPDNVVDILAKHIFSIKSRLNIPDNAVIALGAIQGELGEPWKPVRIFGTVKEMINKYHLKEY